MDALRGMKVGWVYRSMEKRDSRDGMLVKSLNEYMYI